MSDHTGAYGAVIPDFMIMSGPAAAGRGEGVVDVIQTLEAVQTFKTLPADVSSQAVPGVGEIGAVALTTTGKSNDLIGLEGKTSAALISSS
jgi:hypothetical protein